MMTNKETLKKKIIYRSVHRGTKEMDILLGSFVKKYIDKFDHEELLDLNMLLSHDDHIINKCYFDNHLEKIIPNSKISELLKSFKL